MATKGPQLGDGSATANPADANRRMSVTPATLNADQIAAQRAQLNELLIKCLGEEPPAALTRSIIEQTSKKVNVIQGSTTTTRGVDTITRAGDRVMEALLPSLDDPQTTLLRGGYVKMWGELSQSIKRQYDLHLEAGIKSAIADHCNQVLGQINLAVDKAESEIFASATPTAPTTDSFLSAAEAHRWDAAVTSHETLYVELVTLNKRLAAMKKQQGTKFKRCDQLQAAISNFEMVTKEKGKMDEAVAANKCQADFSNYTPVLTNHYVEMVDLGVSPADLTMTFDELNKASDQLQTSTKTTTEAIARHGKTMAEFVAAAPHVTTAFISKSKELADIKADFPKTLTGAKSPATAREFMAAILSVCNQAPDRLALLVSDLELMATTLHYSGTGWRPDKLSTGYQHVPESLRTQYAQQSKNLFAVLKRLVPDDLKKTATPIERDLTVGQVSVRSEKTWISEVAEHDGVAAVEYFLHYHELNGKAERKRILKYFQGVYLSFKGVKDLQEAFENISAKVVELDSYGLNRVDLPWDEVIKPLGYALLSRHNIFSALAAKHATAPSVESSNDCFSALKVFLRQAGSLYDANAHADGVTTPTGDDATAYAAFMASYPQPNVSSGGGGNNAKPNRNRGGGANSSGSTGGGVGGDKNGWKCQCVTDATTKPVVFCGKAVSDMVKMNMIKRNSGKQSALCKDCYTEIRNGGSVLMQNKKGELWTREFKNWTTALYTAALANSDKTTGLLSNEINSPPPQSGDGTTQSPAQTSGLSDQDIAAIARSVRQMSLASAPAEPKIASRDEIKAKLIAAASAHGFSISEGTDERGNIDHLLSGILDPGGGK
jgi:hypothetical protein